MSIFGTILQKLGLQKPEAPVEKPNLTGKAEGYVPPAAKPAVKTPPAQLDPNAPQRPTAFTAPVAPKPAEMPMVDVTAKLDDLAKHFSVPVNWRVSINDLMAILGMDHKPDDIKALAVELGCPESEMGDSYKRNVWTHKALLQQIAANGGKLPADLLK